MNDKEPISEKGPSLSIGQDAGMETGDGLLSKASPVKLVENLDGVAVGLTVGDLVGLRILFEISNESVCPLKSAVPCRFDRKDIEGGKFSEVMLR